VLGPLHERFALRRKFFRALRRGLHDQDEDTYALDRLPCRVKERGPVGPTCRSPAACRAAIATLRNVIVPSLDRAALTTSLLAAHAHPALVISHRRR